MKFANTEAGAAVVGDTVYYKRERMGMRKYRNGIWSFVKYYNSPQWDKNGSYKGSV